MKIAVISAALPPLACGEAASTWFLGRELAARGHDVHVLTTRRPTPIERPPGTTVHDLMTAWTWREAPQLLARLRAIDPEAVLLIYMGAMYGAQPMITFVPTLARRVLPRARFVTRFEHVTGGADVNERSRVARIVYRAARLAAGARGVDDALGTLLRDSAALIALCDLHREQIVGIAPSTADRVTIVPPPPNVEVVPDPTGELRGRGRARLGAHGGDFVVGFFGYVYPNKGIDVLLEAVASLRTRRDAVRLLILGGRSGVPGSAFHAYYDEMQALARSLGLEDRVTWISGFAHGDAAVPELIHAADAWALPFDHGAKLNNSSLTSLAGYGCAMVTTMGAQAEPAFADGENVMIVPARDAEALARALAALAHDPALRSRLAAGAERLAREQLSWAAAAERTVEILRGDARAAR